MKSHLRSPAIRIRPFSLKTPLPLKTVLPQHYELTDGQPPQIPVIVYPLLGKPKFIVHTDMPALKFDHLLPMLNAHATKTAFVNVSPAFIARVTSSNEALYFTSCECHGTFPLPHPLSTKDDIVDFYTILDAFDFLLHIQMKLSNTDMKVEEITTLTFYFY